MSMIELTVQAATDAALTTLLMQHGALVAGEGGVRPAPGIAYSHIGGGELDGVVLSGRYAFLAVDEEAFGQEATGTLLLALQPHRYTGPALRMLLGGSGYNNTGVPFAISARQFKRALLDAGWFGTTVDQMTATINNFLNTLQEPLRSRAILDWVESNEFQRPNQMLAAMAQALGKTPAEVDALFIAGSNIK